MFGLSIGAWMRIVGVLAVVGVCLFAWHEFNEVGSLKKDKANLERQVQDGADALHGANATIDQLKASIESWKKLVVTVADLSKENEQLKQDAAARAAQDKNLKARQEKDDGNAICARLLATDIGAVCPAYADGVRIHAAPH